MSRCAVDNFVENSVQPRQNPHGNWTHPEIGRMHRKLAPFENKDLRRIENESGRTFPNLAQARGETRFCE